MIFNEPEFDYILNNLINDYIKISWQFLSFCLYFGLIGLHYWTSLLSA